MHFEADLVGLVSGTGTATINWGDKSSDTQTVTAPVKGDQLMLEFPHTYAALGIYEVTIQVTDQQGDTATNELEIETGSEFVPTAPTRVLDTRTLGAGGIAPQGTYSLKVVGAGATGQTIPAGVTAVVLNLTATEATGNGYLTAYADDTYAPYQGKMPRPVSSNLNFGTNQNVANLAIVPVGADGTVNIFNGSPTGTVQVIADVAGYFTTSVQNSYVGVGSSRILDTRSGLGSVKAPIGAGNTLNVTVAGGSTRRARRRHRRGRALHHRGLHPQRPPHRLPRRDEPAERLEPELRAERDDLEHGGGPGRRQGADLHREQQHRFISLLPDDLLAPTTSNLNYLSGQTVAGLAFVAANPYPSGANYETAVYTGGQGATYNLILDEFGEFME